MRQIVAFVVLINLLQGTAADKMTWHLCENPETQPSVSVRTVTLSPDPPTIGSPAVFTIEGTSGAVVDSGSVELAVSLSGVQIFEQALDLCGTTTCPVAAGPVSIAITQDLPPIAPPGVYGLQVLARGTAGTELMCIEVEFELVPPSVPALTTLSRAWSQLRTAVRHALPSVLQAGVSDLHLSALQARLGRKDTVDMQAA